MSDSLTRPEALALCAKLGQQGQVYSATMGAEVETCHLHLRDGRSLFLPLFAAVAAHAAGVR